MTTQITDIDVLLATIASTPQKQISAKQQAEMDIKEYFDEFQGSSVLPNNDLFKQASDELIIATYMPNPYFV